MNHTKQDVLRCVKEYYPDASEEEISKVYDSLLERNKLIIAKLDILRIENQQNGERFKAAAYGKVINGIKLLNIPIVSGKQAKKLKIHVGDRIAEKIDEIIKTGTLRVISDRPEETQTRQDILSTFMSIWGVGIATARHWYSIGYRSMDDVKKNQSSLTTQQKLGVIHYDDFNRKIPREEVELFGETIIQIAHDINPAYKVCICGSYRRGVTSLGDVDILIGVENNYSYNTMKTIVDALDRQGVITDIPSMGKNLTYGVGKLLEYYRRIDIRLIPENSWGPGLLYFTGPAGFEREIRENAIQKGYKLNEYGLFKGEKRIDNNTEESIFETLGMNYISPEKRK